MQVGEALGPYRILSELGSGGMGKVYAATVKGRCPGLDDGHADLKMARSLVDEALAQVPEMDHDSICQSLSVNREIMAAWREEFGGE